MYPFEAPLNHSIIFWKRKLMYVLILIEKQWTLNALSTNSPYLPTLLCNLHAYHYSVMCNMKLLLDEWMISEAKTLRPSSNRVRLHTSEDVLNAFGEKHFVLMELRTKGLVPNKGQRRKISQAPNVFQFLLVMCSSSIPQNKELGLLRRRKL